MFFFLLYVCMCVSISDQDFSTIDKKFTYAKVFLSIFFSSLPLTSMGGVFFFFFHNPLAYEIIGPVPIVLVLVRSRTCYNYRRSPLPSSVPQCNCFCKNNCHSSFPRWINFYFFYVFISCLFFISLINNQKWKSKKLYLFIIL